MSDAATYLRGLVECMRGHIHYLVRGIQSLKHAYAIYITIDYNQT